MINFSNKLIDGVAKKLCKSGAITLFEMKDNGDLYLTCEDFSTSVPTNPKNFAIPPVYVDQIHKDDLLNVMQYDSSIASSPLWMMYQTMLETLYIDNVFTVSSFSKQNLESIKMGIESVMLKKYLEDTHKRTFFESRLTWNSHPNNLYDILIEYLFNNQTKVSKTAALEHTLRMLCMPKMHLIKIFAMLRDPIREYNGNPFSLVEVDNFIKETYTLTMDKPRKNEAIKVVWDDMIYYFIPNHN